MPLDVWLVITGLGLRGTHSSNARHVPFDLGLWVIWGELGVWTELAGP